MKLINLTNNGLVEVDEELGKKLIEFHGWAEYKPVRKAAAKPKAKETPEAE